MTLMRNKYCIQTKELCFYRCPHLICICCSNTCLCCNCSNDTGHHSISAIAILTSKLQTHHWTKFRCPSWITESMSQTFWLQFPHKHLLEPLLQNHLSAVLLLWCKIKTKRDCLPLSNGAKWRKPLNRWLFTIIITKRECLSLISINPVLNHTPILIEA